MIRTTDVKVLPLPDAIWHEWLAKGRRRDELTEYRMRFCLSIVPILLVLAWFLTRN